MRGTSGRVRTKKRRVRRTTVASLGLCKAPARFEKIAKVIAHVHKMLMGTGREAAGKKGENEIFWRGRAAKAKGKKKKGEQLFLRFLLLFLLSRSKFSSFALFFKP
jgi:hypothetical protein